MNKPKTQAEIEAFEQWTEYEERRHDRIASNASTILAGLRAGEYENMYTDDASNRAWVIGEAVAIEAEVTSQMGTRRLEAHDD